MRRLIVAVALSGMVVAAPAAAQVYPPDGVTVSVLSSVVSPGGSLDISGSGCGPGSTVAIDVSAANGVGESVVARGIGARAAQQASTTADAQGAFAVSTSAPRDPGLYVVTATCGGASAQTTFRVAGGAAAGPLPSAGSDPWPLVRTGVVLVLVGAAITLIALRRRAARA